MAGCFLKILNMMKQVLRFSVTLQERRGPDDPADFTAVRIHDPGG